MYEVLWDLLKLSLAVGLEGVEASYLIVGAPERAWPGDAWSCSALLSAEWSTREPPGEGSRLLEGAPGRQQDRKAAPHTVATTALATVPIHMARLEDWQVRVARVEDRRRGWTEFAEGRPVEATA